MDGFQSPEVFLHGWMLPPYLKRAPEKIAFFDREGIPLNPRTGPSYCEAKLRVTLKHFSLSFCAKKIWVMR